MRVKEIITEQVGLPWTISSHGEGDFYIQRKGHNAGQPHKNRRSTSEFAVTVNRDVLVPDYFWYVVLHLYQSGAFKPFITGTIGGITKRDINNVIKDFFMSQQVSESKLNENPLALAMPTLGIAGRQLLAKYGPRVVGALTGGMLASSNEDEPELTPEEQELLDQLEKELEGEVTTDGDSYNAGGKYTDDIKADQEKARKQLEKDGIIPTNESIYNDIDGDLKHIDASILRYIEHSEIDDELYDNLDGYINRELDLYKTAIKRSQSHLWGHASKIKPSLLALLEVLEKKGLSPEWIDNHWMNIKNG